MYNNYDTIEKWKKGKEYMNYSKTLNFEPLDKNDWQTLERERQKLIHKYGKEYSESYGWTLKKLAKGRRNIREIEKLVDQDYLRAIYSWASENVHAGVSGIRHKLGLRDNEQRFFLTGPSDFGFLDPVQFTSLSLIKMTEVLLGMEESILNKIFGELMYFFQNELVKTFAED